MPSPRRRNGKSSTRNALPRLESLEARRLLAASPGPTAMIIGDSLIVQGSARADQISILPTDHFGTVRVVANGRNLGNFGPVARVEVNGGEGGDALSVDPRLTLPAKLNGEGGSDVLRGGSGPNALEGGPGNDVLVGTPGRDTFSGGPGRNRQVFQKTMGTIQVSRSASLSCISSASFSLNSAS